MNSPPVVTVLLVFQAICAGVFLYNISSALFGAAPVSWWAHELIEIAAGLGLVLGAFLSVHILRTSRARVAEAEEALRIASGAFHDVLVDRFKRWGLTPAEHDVALFVVKGMTTTEIAELRETSEGTVKAQTNAIYRKAGVGSRAQLVSLFIEDLMDEGVSN